FPPPFAFLFSNSPSSRRRATHICRKKRLEKAEEERLIFAQLLCLPTTALRGLFLPPSLFLKTERSYFENGQAEGWKFWWCARQRFSWQYISPWPVWFWISVTEDCWFGTQTLSRPP
ncbi:Unknown protein, partial [Striga hermonthica]